MRFILAAAVAAVTAAAPAAAVTYDAFASFTGTNTGGAFTYGSLDDTGATTPAFVAYNDTPGCAPLISNTICTSNGFLPGAFKSTTGAHQSGTVIVPGDALVFHPGPNAGQSAAILFTAPLSGVYQLSFSAAVSDNNPSGVVIEAFSPLTQAIPIATLTSTNRTFSFSNFLQPLSATDTVGFAVNYAGSYNNDSTAITFTATRVPEPATWAMMVAGFGLVGFGVRRRRVTLAA